MKKQSEAGFTLLELMAGVVLVGGLAALAIPSFASSAHKSKMDTEANAIMGELRLREESFLAEHTQYISTGVTETDMFPSTPSYNAEPLPDLPEAWTKLQVHLSLTETSCTYVVIAGGPNDNPGTIATEEFGYRKPEGRNWYYVLGRCYASDNSDKYYFASDEDGTVRASGDVDVNPVAHSGDSVVATTDNPPPAPTPNTAPTPSVPTPTGGDPGSTGSTGSTGGTNSITPGGSTTGTTGMTGGNDTTTTTTTPGNGSGSGGGSGSGSGSTSTDGKHANAGNGNGTECVNGVEVDPGNSGSHNNDTKEGGCGTTGKK